MTMKPKTYMLYLQGYQPRERTSVIRLIRSGQVDIRRAPPRPRKHKKIIGAGLRPGPMAGFSRCCTKTCWLIELGTPLPLLGNNATVNPLDDHS